MTYKKELYIKKNKCYVFLDTEFNSTGNNKQDIIDNTNEILSIGFILTDGYFREIKKFHQYVKPLNFTHVYENCTKITGITDKDILSAIPFEETFLHILEEFKEYDIDKIFIYGIMDKIVIKNDCIKANIEKNIYSSFINKMFNIQPYLNSILPFPNQNQWGMKQVCKYFNVNFEFMHNAFEDANLLLSCTKKYIENYRNPYYYNRLKEVVLKKNKNQ